MTKTMKICLALLFLPVFVLGGFMLKLSYMSNFDKVEIAVTGYDPKSLISGYFVDLRPDWNRTNCSQFADNVCPKDEFGASFNFYTNKEKAAELEKILNFGGNTDAKAVFSYQKGFTPIMVGLKINGVLVGGETEQAKNK